MNSMDQLLLQSSALHRHLCPRQVLGVRMGTLAGELLGLRLPQTDKQLLTFVETDGCFADGVAVATNCWVGRRSLRVLDYGKVAATFVDTHTGRAVRLHPHPQAREHAGRYAPEARNRWEGYLLGYRRMPDDVLFIQQAVGLSRPIDVLLSRPSAQARCQVCGEEIINERELVHEGSVLCRPCAGETYYRPIPARSQPPLHAISPHNRPQARPSTTSRR